MAAKTAHMRLNYFFPQPWRKKANGFFATASPLKNQNGDIVGCRWDPAGPHTAQASGRCYSSSLRKSPRTILDQIEDGYYEVDLTDGSCSSTMPSAGYSDIQGKSWQECPSKVICRACIYQKDIQRCTTACSGRANPWNPLNGKSSRKRQVGKRDCPVLRFSHEEYLRTLRHGIIRGESYVNVTDQTKERWERTAQV